MRPPLSAVSCYLHWVLIVHVHKEVQHFIILVVCPFLEVPF